MRSLCQFLRSQSIKTIILPLHLSNERFVVGHLYSAWLPYASLYRLLLHTRMEPSVIRPAPCPSGNPLSLLLSAGQFLLNTSKVSSTSVNVSWQGLLLFSECADNLRVKHFFNHNEDQYEVAAFVNSLIYVIVAPS